MVWAKRPYRAIVALCLTAYCLAYDARRYLRWSAAVNKRGSEAKRQALVTKYYHIVEKGLALPAPRPGFGKYAVGELVELLRAGQGDRPYRLAKEALVAYHQFNQAAGAPSPDELNTYLEEVRSRGEEIIGSATKVASSQTASWFGDVDPMFFFGSRQSVRDFSQEQIPRDLLMRAVHIAQSSPSVCNRQATRVHFITNPATKRQVLSLQDGNRGFGDAAPVVAVVTTSLDHFVDPTERYQAWIDGGIFSMTLLLGFHSLGLASCPLNWSAHPRNDKALRKVLGLTNAESVILLIAVGKAASGAMVARSPRKLIADVISWHGSVE
jgi:nitroreductase